MLRYRCCLGSFLVCVSDKLKIPHVNSISNPLRLAYASVPGICLLLVPVCDSACVTSSWKPCMSCVYNMHGVSTTLQQVDLKVCSVCGKNKNKRARRFAVDMYLVLQLGCSVKNSSSLSDSNVDNRVEKITLFSVGRMSPSCCLLDMYSTP